MALTVNGRYEFGLTDINDSGVAGDPFIKYRAFPVSGGVLLRVR